MSLALVVGQEIADRYLRAHKTVKKIFSNISFASLGGRKVGASYRTNLTVSRFVRYRDGASPSGETRDCPRIPKAKRDRAELER